MVMPLVLLDVHAEEESDGEICIPQNFKIPTRGHLDLNDCLAHHLL